MVPFGLGTCGNVGVLEHRDRSAPGVPGSRYRPLGQRTLAEYLFAHTVVERVQAWTDAKNVAEQRALESAGFTREGVVRMAQWRQGAWHDQVLYSVLRSELPDGV